MIAEDTLRRWMKAALAAAIQGVVEGQSPFGAVIYQSDGTHVATAYNRVAALTSPIAHAEVLAIEQACHSRDTLELSDCWLVSTAEPCPMCAATAATVGIRHVAFGAPRQAVEQAGYSTLGLGCAELFSATTQAVAVHGPILEAECVALLWNHPHT